MPSLDHANARVIGPQSQSSVPTITRYNHCKNLSVFLYLDLRSSNFSSPEIALYRNITWPSHDFPSLAPSYVTQSGGGDRPQVIDREITVVLLIALTSFSCEERSCEQTLSGDRKSLGKKKSSFTFIKACWIDFIFKLRWDGEAHSLITAAAVTTTDCECRERNAR